MIALDLDEALWQLSKYGCTNRNNVTGNCPEYNICEVREHCVMEKFQFQKARYLWILGSNKMSGLCIVSFGKRKIWDKYPDIGPKKKKYV